MLSQPIFEQQSVGILSKVLHFNKNKKRTEKGIKSERTTVVDSLSAIV